MRKWISMAAILVLLLGFSNGKEIKGEALNSYNEADNEIVSPQI